MSTAIFLTDADSLLGRHVLAELRNTHPDREVFALSGDEHDLSDRDATLALFARLKPGAVIHLQSRLSRDDAWWEVADRMNWDMQAVLSLYEASAAVGVTSVTTVARGATYPADASVPLVETDYMNGQPDRTTAPYSHAARLAVMLAEAYRWQYGQKSTHIVHSEIFGELAEATDALDTPGKIIADITAARRFNKIQLELGFHADDQMDIIYAADLAESVVRCINEPAGGVLNQSAGEISIRTFAQVAAEIIGYGGALKFSRKASVLGRPLALIRQQDLGYAQRSLRQALERIAKQSGRAAHRLVIDHDPGGA